MCLKMIVCSSCTCATCCAQILIFCFVTKIKEMLMIVHIFNTVSLFVQLLSTEQQFKVLNIWYEGAKSGTASLHVCVHSTVTVSLRSLLCSMLLSYRAETT